MTWIIPLKKSYADASCTSEPSYTPHPDSTWNQRICFFLNLIQICFEIQLFYVITIVPPIQKNISLVGTLPEHNRSDHESLQGF